MPEDCPEEVAQLILECMATDPAARPSAVDVVRRLQVAPVSALLRQNDSAGGASVASCVVGGLQRQGDSAGGASVASSIVGGLQRQGDSTGGASVASTILGELQHQNDSVGGHSMASSIGGYLLQRDTAGGLSVASTIAGALQKQHDCSSAITAESDSSTVPGLLPPPALQSTGDGGKQQRPVAVVGEPGFHSHSTESIELAWFGTKAGFAAGSAAEASSVSSSGAPSFSSLSAGERYTDMPRSFSGAVSAPSTTGALSFSVAATAASRSGSQLDSGSFEGAVAAEVGGQAARAGLQSASAIVARVSEPANPWMLRSASNIGPYPSRLRVGAAPAEDVSTRSFARAAERPSGGDVQALSQGAIPPISPFVASRQTQQRRLPVSPFSEQQ